jgi:hypothetical protein
MLCLWIQVFSEKAEVEPMTSKPITIREATTEDIAFLQAMIWEVILASLILLAHSGVEALQQMEDQ